MSMFRWSTRTLNFVSDTMLAMVVLALLTASLVWLSHKPVFWLTGIDVEVLGNQEAVTAPALVEHLKEKVSGTYFTANIEFITDELKKLPWVKRASVYRQWPNKLRLSLLLHHPLAAWGDDQLLAEDGTIFVANQDLVDHSLPKIFGPEESSTEIYELYLELDKTCKPLGYEMASLSFSELSGWLVHFRKPDGKNIEVVFKASEKPTDMETKLKEIMAGLPKMTEYFGLQPERIDARYHKGVAVARPVPPPEPAETEEQGNGNG